jgi:hypothetical protein
MAASYPTSVKAFSTRNAGDTIQAAHVNDLQDEVTAIENALLNGISHAVAITGGALTVGGFGPHTFSAAGTGGNYILTKNQTAGTANYGGFIAQNDSTINAYVKSYSTTFTPSAQALASGAEFSGDGVGGVSLAALHASGVLRLYTAAQLRAQISAAGLFEHNNAFALTGIVTPAQITANTNDYAPASFAAAYLLRLSSDAARDVTGIAGGAQGRIVLLSNQGSFTITLKHNSGSSTAGNRFLCPGAVDFALTTFMTRAIYYDSTAAAWLVMGA